MAIGHLEGLITVGKDGVTRNAIVVERFSASRLLRDCGSTMQKPVGLFVDVQALVLCFVSLVLLWFADAR